MAIYVRCSGIYVESQSIVIVSVKLAKICENNKKYSTKMRQMESKSVIIFDIQLLADVEIIMEAVIIRIDNSHASIGRRYFQSFQQI